MCWKWNWKIKWLLWQVRDDGGGTVHTSLSRPWGKLTGQNYASGKLPWATFLYGYYTLVPDTFCYKVFTAISLYSSCKKKTTSCALPRYSSCSVLKNNMAAARNDSVAYDGNRYNIFSPYRLQRGLRRRSAATLLLGSRVRIMPREDACPSCLSCAV
jgi:hypothetical protein